VLLAAAKGVVGATTVTIGLIMLPSMLRHGYDPRLAAGTVAATATLAQIFPPATVLVLLGDQMSNAYQAAQLSQGIFAPLSVTVSDLFAGAIIPALALVAFYLIYLIAVAMLCPQASPALPPDREGARGTVLVLRLLQVLVAPVLLILAVIGSILAGMATPTEAASVGAVGAMVAVLGGLDALVFTGGIGEHSSRVRRAVAGALGYAGLRLDEARNASPTGDVDVAADDSAVRALVVAAREELAILGELRRLLYPTLVPTSGAVGRSGRGGQLTAGDPRHDQEALQ